MALCYGIEINNGISAMQARDALSECFFQAHGDSTGFSMSSAKEKDIVKNYCNLVVKNAFKDTNGDFNNPTKESIINAMNYLAKFSEAFRDPAIINKHHQNMMQVCQAIK